MGKILITGGFGFIGLRLANFLSSKKYDVVILEHHNAIKPLSLLPSIKVIRADITDDLEMEGLDLKDFEAVLHLAAQSSGPKSFGIPHLDIRLNIIGTLNVINLCVKNKIERLIFASSFVVYGDHPESEVLDEEFSCRPKSVYATTKLACEHLLSVYAEPKGIKWNALRMFNVYGPGQDINKGEQGVVGIFMKMLMGGPKVEVKGSLSRFRDLVYIDDVIDIWEKCLASKEYNKIFNVGSGKKTTFSELINQLASTIGVDNLEVINTQGTPGDLNGCYASTARLKVLGVEDLVDTNYGFKKMYEWQLRKI